MRNSSFLCHVTTSDGNNFQVYGGLDKTKWD